MALIALKDPSLWTLGQGLRTDGGTMLLDNLVAEDRFEDASLDSSLWGTLLVQGSGSASISEAGGKVSIATTSDDAAAMLYYREVLSPRGSSKWRLRLKVSSPDFQIVLAALMQTGVMPVLASYGNSVSVMEYNAGGLISAALWMQDNARDYWNGYWQGAYSTVDSVSADEQRIVEYENDGANLIMRIHNAEGSECIFYSVTPWTDIKAESNDLHACLGDPYSTSQHGQLHLHEFQHYGPYASQAAATMGQVTVGTFIDRLPVTESLESGAYITWRYDRDESGFVMPGSGSLAELKSALEGEFVGMLDLEATFHSDGLAGGGFDMGQGVIGSTPPPCFSQPLRVVELPGPEAIEI